KSKGDNDVGDTTVFHYDVGKGCRYTVGTLPNKQQSLKNVPVWHLYKYVLEATTLMCYNCLWKEGVWPLIGERIKKLRQEKNMSISELAEKANVAKSYLSSIERNHKV